MCLTCISFSPPLEGRHSKVQNSKAFIEKTVGAAGWMTPRQTRESESKRARARGRNMRKDGRGSGRRATGFNKGRREGYPKAARARPRPRVLRLWPDTT